MLNRSVAGEYSIYNFGTADGGANLVDTPNTPITYILENAPSEPLDGSGTEEDPYQITECFTATESGYYELQNDITEVDQDCIVIEADDVFIDGAGYTITSVDVEQEELDIQAIFSEGYNRISISDIAIDGFYDGIMLYNIEGPSIISDVTIENSYDDGIDVEGVRDITISGNTITSIGDDGIQVREYETEGPSIASEDVIITDNTISEIYENGIEISEVENLSITDNTISYTDDDDGINLDYVSQAVISGNTLSHIGSDGIYIENSEDISIYDNTFDDIDADGIDIDEDSESIAIYDNTLTNIGDSAFEASYSEGISIYDNTASGMSGMGVSIYEVINLSIEDNSFESMSYMGISISDSYDIVIVDNTIIDFSLEFNEGDIGMWISDSGNFTITGNTIQAAEGEVFESTYGIYVSGTYSEDEEGDSLRDYFFNHNLVEFSGDSEGFSPQSVNLEDYLGKQVTLKFVYTGDGSVTGSGTGAYVDDIQINVNGNPVFSDDVESGLNGWEVFTDYGSPWVIEDVGEDAPSGSYLWTLAEYLYDGQYTEFRRTVDLTGATSANVSFNLAYTTEDCCDYVGVLVDEIENEEEEGEEEEETREILQNTILVGNYGIALSGISEVTVVGNTIQSDHWIYNNAEDNTFNDEDSGNTYRFADGSGAWTMFNIIDSSNNGFADSGTDRPFNQDVLGEDLWSGEGEDMYPATESKNTVTRRRTSSGGSVQMRVQNLQNQGKTDDADKLKDQFKNLFDKETPTVESLMKKVAELQALLAKLQGQPTPSTDTTPLVCSPLLKKGTQSEEVRKLQKRLGVKPESGLFASITENAVKAFQTQKGIRVDGIVGPETCAMFN